VSEFNESPPGAPLARFFDNLAALVTPHSGLRPDPRQTPGAYRYYAWALFVMPGHLFVSEDAMLWLVTWVQANSFVRPHDHLFGLRTGSTTRTPLGHAGPAAGGAGYGAT
jgi:hypothetical protein